MSSRREWIRQQSGVFLLEERELLLCSGNALLEGRGLLLESVYSLDPNLKIRDGITKGRSDAYFDNNGLWLIRDWSGVDEFKSQGQNEQKKLHVSSWEGVKLSRKGDRSEGDQSDNG